MLSQTAGYAILAMCCMEGPDGKPVLVRDIAEATGIPKPYLSKLIHVLGHSGLILTKRGHSGGVVLSRPPKRINLLEVAKAVDGDDFLPCCLLGFPKNWHLRVCLTMPSWKQERERMEKKLRRTSLADLACTEDAPGECMRHRCAACATKANVPARGKAGKK